MSVKLAPLKFSLLTIASFTGLRKWTAQHACRYCPISKSIDDLCGPMEKNFHKCTRYACTLHDLKQCLHAEKTSFIPTTCNSHHNIKLLSTYINLRHPLICIELVLTSQTTVPLNSLEDVGSDHACVLAIVYWIASLATLVCLVGLSYRNNF